METYQIVLIALASLLGIIILGMIIKTLALKPKKIEKKKFDEIDVDGKVLANHLSNAIKIPTVSMVEEYSNNQKAFEDYHEYLKKTFPLIHKEATLTKINGYSLIYRFKGSDETLLPACFLAHQDVVPASNEGWDYPPFSGTITEDGFIYGRGAQDMKHHMFSLMEGMEALLKKGVEFDRDIYFCFGHDEEPGTSFEGAPYIVKYFEEKKIKFEYVVDEGGTIIDGKILGVKGNLAMIGICEKGNSDIELSVKVKGGHASNPESKTAVGELSKAIYKVQCHPMPTHWTAVTKETFKRLAPQSNGIFKFLFANRAILSPLLKFALTKATSMTNALVRTTFSPTMLWGADARNALPYEAKANLNTRIITGETMEDVHKYLHRLLGKKVEVKTVDYTPPTTTGDVNSFGYKQLENTIEEVFGTVSIPYMFIAASDARFYSSLSNNVFRFGPFMFDIDDQNRIHGINERITIDALKKATIFFARFIENTCTKK